MLKFEYMTCNRNYGEETTEEFINKLNKLGANGWEVICTISCILSNFEQLLLKRVKGE